MKKALFKVPNGKLLKISIQDENNAIAELKINGDFFVYPEENLAELEKELIGAHIEDTILCEKIEDFLKRTQTTFYGLDAVSLAQTIVVAANSPSL